MKKFLLTYWVSLIVLFTLFYWEYSLLSQIINTFQTNFTSLISSLTLTEGIIEGHRIFISENYILVIEKSCNGTIPYLFFLASLIAFPATRSHKLQWMVLGYFFITAVNAFRIWMISEFVMQDQSNFTLVHDYLGNALLIGTGLLLFILFVKSRYQPVKAQSIQKEAFLYARSH